MAWSTDFLVIGGGIIGLNLALQAKKRYPDSRVTLIEKEKDCGIHASGRNSGVLHAGFYYSADSLKARFARDGNRRLTEYCHQRGLHINPCGKLVVARDEADLAGLKELLIRANNNQVELYELTEKEAREIEPRAKTHQHALYSPTTASVNPSQIVASLIKDARNQGIEILADTAYLRREPDGVRTSRGIISAGYIINAAGLYADKIARDFGFSKDYRILPFKGLYLYANEGDATLKTNVYPVPDLNNPFLGVHYTISVDGKVKIGPTAIPAFWREHYNGFSNFRLKECLEIIGREIAMFARNDFGFRSLAWSELKKYHRPKLIRLASALVRGVAEQNYRSWGQPGIRAQLVNTRQRRLEMDFHFEGDERSFHVLNAVSPAFTCSIPFTEYLADHMDRLAA